MYSNSVRWLRASRFRSRWVNDFEDRIVLFSFEIGTTAWEHTARGQLHVKRCRTKPSKAVSLGSRPRCRTYHGWPGSVRMTTQPRHTSFILFWLVLLFEGLHTVPRRKRSSGEIRSWRRGDVDHQARPRSLDKDEQKQATARVDSTKPGVMVGELARLLGSWRSASMDVCVGVAAVKVDEGIAARLAGKTSRRPRRRAKQGSRRQEAGGVLLSSTRGER